MVDVILITNHRRPKLLDQCIATLTNNTPKLSLTIVSDTPDCGIVGALKNSGAHNFDRKNDYVCFIDDDVAFFPGWSETLAEKLTKYNKLRIVGGVRHPFHGVNEDWGDIQITDAVAGYCHFMRWSTWEKMGPYHAHAKGTGQSEDWALCQEVIENGGVVGYVNPPVMAHCGITDSLGRKILGADLIERVEGILYE